MPASVLSINGDVLRQITLVASRKTCARLMRTCRFLYHEAAISALQNEVYLACDAQVDKFLRFMDAEDQTRFRYVHTLRLHLHHLSFKQGQMVVSSMARMTCLTSLDLSDGEHALRTYPGMDVVLAQITTLRHLGSCTVGWRFIALLDHLTCNLTSISLDWGAVIDQSFLHREVAPDQWANYHPVPFLSKWTHCLEELHCSNWYTPDFEDNPQFTAVYPKMRKLVIIRDDFPDPLPYIRAYPNLTHFRVQSNHIYGLTAPLSYQDLLRRRCKNLERRARWNDSSSWRYLEECSGYLEDLYIFGLPCRIDRIVLHNALTDYLPELLLEVLLYAKPLHLKVDGDGAFLHGHSRNLDLPSILGELGASRLESLHLNIKLRREDGTVDLGPGLVSVCYACTRPAYSSVCSSRADCIHVCTRMSSAPPSAIPRQSARGRSHAEGDTRSASPTAIRPTASIQRG